MLTPEEFVAAGDHLVRNGSSSNWVKSWDRPEYAWRELAVVVRWKKVWMA